MRVLRAEVKNFGSYKNLKIDFCERRLTLVSGPTGSGKSTLCDIIPWVLFGRTSKDGSVDEVCSWDAEGPTEGTVFISTSAAEFYVVRTRKPNDLYFVASPYDECAFRGKDLADTQKLINERLGMTAETFLAGSYYHELNQTASFFTANAKTRRLITEQLVDMSFPKTLSENLTAYKKEVKEEVQLTKEKLSAERARLKDIEQSINDTEIRLISWQESHTKQYDTAIRALDNRTTEHDKRLSEWQKKYDSFEADRQATLKLFQDDQACILKTLKTPEYFAEKRAILQKRKAACGDDTCKECGTKKNSASILVLTRDEYAIDREEETDRQNRLRLKAYQTEYDKQAKVPNPHVKPTAPDLTLLQENKDNLMRQKNPHVAVLVKHQNSCDTIKAMRDKLQSTLHDLTQEMLDIDILLDITKEFRSYKIETTVRALEQDTNSFLTEHFDAEIRVTFAVAADDKLEVDIYKDGHQAAFTQLSKGQRCLLKLCFAVAVMRSVSKHNAVSFNCLFFDEALDGLSEELKIKAVGLFQKLSIDYESVFVVEHNEAFKSHFDNKLEVSLNQGWSGIEETQ